MTMLLMSGALTASLLAGCNDDPTTAPTTGGTTTPSAPTTPSTPTTPAGAPTTAAVNVGDIFFKSANNGSSNPAVDTVAVNGTVTWTWAAGETFPHSVQSLGSPSFTSSGILSGAGNTYQFTFTAPGSYNYNCAIHGNLMTGTIVVPAAAGSDSMAPPPADTASTPTPPPVGY